MKRTKKSNRVSSDGVHKKKSVLKSTTLLNPFEVHVNKEKFTILGRKCKHDKGLPGVSRAKALKKRKATIGKEYTDFNKTNKFKDMRIGRGLPVNDELAEARFTAEKINQTKVKKKDLFNLNDGEVLTHNGQTLEEIEQFKDPGSEDSGDDELDADFTETAHFGGEGSKTDRKAAIEDIIADAKRKKIETAKERDEVYELTQKLDADYKSIIPLIGKLNKSEKHIKSKPDDYDRALREMIFEPRGEVSDKLQSEEDLIKKEKSRLEKLEKERRDRMLGQTENDLQPKHRSADDLDDGYCIDSEDDYNEPTLAYDINDQSNNVLNNNENINETSDGNNSNEDNESEESDSSDESEEDNLSDLKMSDSESDDESKDMELTDNNIKRKANDFNDLDIPSKKKREIKNNSGKVNHKSQTYKTLPFTYDMPDSYELFSNLLTEQPHDYQGVIIERIIKCNHPKLDESNKQKMITLFAYLLQHINDQFIEANSSNIKKSFLILDRISPHIFDLVNMNPEKMSYTFLEVIKEKYNEYKKNQKVFPDLSILVYLKLVSNLFSTSDFFHPVVTPSIVFISHMLSQARVRNRRDIAIGLFLATLSIEYTQLSKRFIPSVLNYLLGILFLAINKRPIELLKIVPPFSSVGPKNNLLVLERRIEKTEEELLTSNDLVTDLIDEEFKVRAVYLSLRLINDVMELVKDNTGACYLAEPFLNMFDRLDIAKYPEFVKENFENAKNILNSCLNQKMLKLRSADRKPKALRLMEPLIFKVYDDKRRPKLSKEKEMRAILVHKIKRETKGAMREIRRDSAFITNMQIKKQLQSDLERKEKVQRIYAEASIQQGELNAMARNKKHL